jgi:hypothetical protein
MEKTFKVVIFIDSSMPQQQTYMNNQLLAIQKELPDLAIEIENESSPLLLRHAKHPTRVPCYMIFKNELSMFLVRR